MKEHVLTLLAVAATAGCSQASFPNAENSSPPPDFLTLGAGTMTAKDLEDRPVLAGFNQLTAVTFWVDPQSSSYGSRGVSDQCQRSASAAECDNSALPEAG